MRRINRDTIVAICLLLMCGAFYGASFQIRDMGYESLGSEAWPRIILIVLTALSLLYLVRSLGKPPEPSAESSRAGAKGLAGFKAWYATYRNAIACFVAFALFLITLPYLGMLIGGVLFVFVTLTLLGGWDVKSLVTHGAIAVLAVGAMWSVFTFALRVILPGGEIFPAF
ncbi:MAG: tripartite tricarboxylate transporter TctB family protein [Kiloniellaceae bacterium]